MNTRQIHTALWTAVDAARDGDLDTWEAIDALDHALNQGWITQADRDTFQGHLDTPKPAAEYTSEYRANG